MRPRAGAPAAATGFAALSAASARAARLGRRRAHVLACSELRRACGRVGGLRSRSQRLVQLFAPFGVALGFLGHVVGAAARASASRVRATSRLCSDLTSALGGGVVER